MSFGSGPARPRHRETHFVELLWGGGGGGGKSVEKMTPPCLGAENHESFGCCRFSKLISGPASVGFVRAGVGQALVEFTHLQPLLLCWQFGLREPLVSNVKRDWGWCDGIFLLRYERTFLWSLALPSAHRNPCRRLKMPAPNNNGLHWASAQPAYEVFLEWTGQKSKSPRRGCQIKAEEAYIGEKGTYRNHFGLFGACSRTLRQGVELFVEPFVKSFFCPIHTTPKEFLVRTPLDPPT